MIRTLRTVEEIFGEPLPPLTEEQKTQLEEMLAWMVETCFRGTYQTPARGERNRAIARRVLLEGKTLRQAAEEFGITYTRVGQLRLKALRLLRYPGRSIPLKDIFKVRESEMYRQFKGTGDLYADAAAWGQNQAKLEAEAEGSETPEINRVLYWTAWYSGRRASGAMLDEALRLRVTPEQWESLRRVAAEVAYD